MLGGVVGCDLFCCIRERIDSCKFERWVLMKASSCKMIGLGWFAEGGSDVVDVGGKYWEKRLAVLGCSIALI